MPNGQVMTGKGDRNLPQNKVTNYADQTRSILFIHRVGMTSQLVISTGGHENAKTVSKERREFYFK